MKYYIETIYLLCGQFDSYCSFDFYPDSYASNNYGNSAHGIIVHNPIERKNLEESISKGEIEFLNDGIIHIDTGSKDFNKKHSLLNKGFSASDIKRLSVVGGIDNKAYGSDNENKKVPFSININFESEDILDKIG